MTKEEILERISRKSLDPMESLLGVLETDPHKLAELLAEIMEKINKG